MPQKVILFEAFFIPISSNFLPKNDHYWYSKHIAEKT